MMKYYVFYTSDTTGLFLLQHNIPREYIKRRHQLWLTIFSVCRQYSQTIDVSSHLLYPRRITAIRATSESFVTFEELSVNKNWYFPSVIHPFPPSLSIVRIDNEYVFSSSSLSAHDNDFLYDTFYQTPSSFILWIRQLNHTFTTTDTLRIEIDSLKFNLGPLKLHHEQIWLYHPSLHITPRWSMSPCAIPKIIHMTFQQPITFYEYYMAVTSFVDKHYTYTLYFYQDSDCFQFMKKKGYSETYAKLVSGSYRADLWRYAIIFEYGGFYFDAKMIMRHCIDDLLQIQDEIIVCNDITNQSIYHGFYNAIIASIPSQPCFLQLIADIQESIRNSMIPSHTLELTGPQRFYSIMKDISHKTILFQCISDFTNQYLENYVTILRPPRQFQKLCHRFYQGHRMHPIYHYSTLFHKQLFYYYPIQTTIKEDGDTTILSVAYPTHRISALPHFLRLFTSIEITLNDDHHLSLYFHKAEDKICPQSLHSSLPSFPYLYFQLESSSSLVSTTVLVSSLFDITDFNPVSQEDD